MKFSALDASVVEATTLSFHVSRLWPLSLIGRIESMMMAFKPSHMATFTTSDFTSFSTILKVAQAIAEAELTPREKF